MKIAHEYSPLSLDNPNKCDSSCEKGPYGNSEKYQPVQSTQADHSQNFTPLSDFLCIKW